MPIPATAAAAPDAGEEPVPASLVLSGGKIYTPAGPVEAMAVDEYGVIVALGDRVDVGKHISPATKTIELDGKAVLPGFHDMHVHPVYAGLRAAECVIEQGANLEVVHERLKACIARSEPGEWVTGGQWDTSSLGQVPTRQMLDVVSPDNPVYLRASSGHSAWVNTLALEKAGVTRGTEAPDGGVIEYDEAGDPLGVLRESAMRLVNDHVPRPSEEQFRASIKYSLDTMLSYGITSFTEAALRDGGLEAYASLIDDGTMKQRAKLCLMWNAGHHKSQLIGADRNRFRRDRLQTDCVKVLVDGVPTDSHTAAMLEPYAGTVEGRDDDASRFGLLLVPQEELNKAVTEFDRMGLKVKFHAAGDAAVRASLDAIEAARKANGFGGQLHDVGHCTFVSMEDIERARDIGATFEVSPYLWAPGSPINDSIISAIADERMDRVWPMKDMFDAGALVVGGSDWSVVPSVNPWIGIETAITRENPGEIEGDSYGKAEAIMLDQAIAMFTTNAARHNGVSDIVGSIELGMLADVIVLDQDPYEVPTKALHKTNVLVTIINGEVVYRR